MYSKAGVAYLKEHPKFMEYRTKGLTIRPVTHKDLNGVAGMWNFEKGEISLEEAEKAAELYK